MLTLCDIMNPHSKGDNMFSEREDALWNESLSQGAAYQSSAREWAASVGSENPHLEWISTNYDTYERNPFYRGAPGPHPEYL